MEPWIWVIAGSLFLAVVIWRASKGRDFVAEARLERETRFERATGGWTSPVLVRTYTTNEEGNLRFQDEAAELAAHGYHPTTQSAEGSHIHAGRIVLTGGLSLLAGRSGTRSDGKLMVTYQKANAATPSLATELRALAALRDEGILTEGEFESRKQRLLR